MKFIKYIYILILFNCNSKINYNQTTAILNEIVDIHNGISIGRRGNIMTVSIKTDNKIICKDLSYDSINNKYFIKDFGNQDLQDYLKIINISQLELGNKLNRIIDINIKNNLIASNCIEDENCYKCIFWLTEKEYLILLKEDEKICNYYLNKAEIINNNWIYLKE